MWEDFIIRIFIVIGIMVLIILLTHDDDCKESEFYVEEDTNMTLENLLRIKARETSPVSKEVVELSPDFRVAVQNLDAEFGGEKGVHVIIHADGHDSVTLDLLVCGNKTFKLY